MSNDRQERIDSILLPMVNDAQHEAQCLIERIMSDCNLDRAVIGPRFEALVNSSLEV
jgi:predicted transcriptional regulator